MKRFFEAGLAVLSLMFLFCACGREKSVVQEHPAESAIPPTVAGEPEACCDVRCGHTDRVSRL